MCKAAKVTIAEVDEIVETGEIPGEEVHVPHLFVHRIVQAANTKRIEVSSAQSCRLPSEGSKGRTGDVTKFQFRS